MMRPIVLGVVGDSGAGKTTVTRGLVRVMSSDQVTVISGDDYHRYDRHERRQRRITPLHPDANHLDVLTQDLRVLRRGGAILKPVYDHRDGTLGRPTYVESQPFLIVEGLLNYHTETLRSTHDVRVFLAPAEDLRRAWKLKRDCARRRYTTDDVLRELDTRERDCAAYIRPQQAYADIVVSFRRGKLGDPAHLDADVLLRETLPHPDLSPLLDAESETGGPTLAKLDHDMLLRIPGDIAPERAAEIEEAVWDRMRFADHLRVRRLGEFTVGTDLLRSDSLALVQVLILYHLVWARATLATGGEQPRSEPRGPVQADRVLHR